MCYIWSVFSLFYSDDFSVIHQMYICVTIPDERKTSMPQQLAEIHNILYGKIILWEIQNWW